MSDNAIFVSFAAAIGLNVMGACMESNLMAPFNAGVAVFIAILLADILLNKQNGRWR